MDSAMCHVSQANERCEMTVTRGEVSSVCKTVPSSTYRCKSTEQVTGSTVGK